jgi:hypothetical protein
MQKQMAWRPYSNLIDGELDNRVPGKVTGWLRFFRNGRQPLTVALDLAGDFHDDIRGKMIRLSNPEPRDEYGDADGTYMDGFAELQRGTAGDITAGLSLGPWSDAIAENLMAQHEIVWEEAGVSGAERERRRQECAERYRAHIAAGDPYHPYVPYPYIEWYADNGRVVLELDPSQVAIVDSAPVSDKSAQELVADERNRRAALGTFLGSLVEDVSRKNREQGGDGKVFGVIVE